jgi:hypothetical protein
MNDLVRIIREFLYRDLAFILGGTIVIGSFVYSTQLWPPNVDLQNPPLWSLILFPAMAYVVGYAVQDVGGLIGISYTGYVTEPNWFCRSLFSCFSKYHVGGYEFPPKQQSLSVRGTHEPAGCS